MFNTPAISDFKERMACKAPGPATKANPTVPTSFDQPVAERIFAAALAAHDSGATEDARLGFQRVSILEPSHMRPVAVLGSLERGCGNRARAAELLNRAAVLDGGSAPVQYTLGNAHLDCGDLDLGRNAYRRALVISPAYEQAITNLGLLEIESADPIAARRVLRRALIADPASGVPRSLLGEVHLAAGAFTSGWPLYFTRMSEANRDRKLDGSPFWNGGPSAGGGLLLLGDGGIGDVLMHARFLKQLKAPAGPVTPRAPAPLTALLQTAFPSITVTDLSAPAPGAGAWLPLSMLAMRLEVTPDAAGARSDYLARCFHGSAIRPGRRKVGLCWQGQDGTFRQRKRALPPTLLETLADIPHADYLCLQVGSDAVEPRPALAMDNRTESYLGAEGMVRMARDMVDLDLVLTVDTYVAHLAGALGIETWVMLPHGPEWRWGPRGDRTPWYPRARLFRQSRQGDWDTVIAQVRGAMAARFQ